ncbi:CRAL-TRIO domain-containing protein [Cladochytrium replicatum]|nr:CRAL-TRIO domain-containing protein [Cladochytrium replicatum]
MTTPLTPDGLPSHMAVLREEERALLREMWKRTLEEIAELDADAEDDGVIPQPAFIALKGSHQAPTVEPGHTLPVTDPGFVTEGVRIASTYLDYFWITLGIEHHDLMLTRFLRARKWDVEKAVQMFINSLKWRMEIGHLELLREGEVCVDQEEIRLNKVYFYEYDKEGRPIGYIHVRLHDKYKITMELSKRMAIVLLEAGRQLLRPPVTSATLIFDMANFGLTNMDYNYVSFLLQTMEAHYPESLGAALILNAPWIFTGCWQIIRPWLDPVVASKVHFIQTSDLPKFIDEEKVIRAIDPVYYGTDWEYEFSEPTDDDLALEKKIRSDKAGQDIGREEYKAALVEFEAINREWFDIEGEEPSIETEVKREKAGRKVREKLAVLDKFMRGRTSYHRAGVIPEATEILQRITSVN